MPAPTILPDLDKEHTWPAFFESRRQEGDTILPWLTWAFDNQPRFTSHLAFIILDTWPVTGHAFRFLQERQRFHSVRKGDEFPRGFQDIPASVKKQAVTKAFLHLSKAKDHSQVDFSGLIDTCLRLGWLSGDDPRISKIIKKLSLEENRLADPFLKWKERNTSRDRLRISEGFEYISRIPNLSRADLETIIELAGPLSKRDSGELKSWHPEDDHLLNRYKEVMGRLLNQANVPEHILNWLDGATYFGWLATELTNHPRLSDYPSWRLHLVNAIAKYSPRDFNGSKGLHTLLKIMSPAEQLSMMKCFEEYLSGHYSARFSIPFNQDILRKDLAASPVPPSPTALAPWLNQQDRDQRLKWIQFAATLTTPLSPLPKPRSI